MNVQREHDHLRLTFNFLEARVLRHILETIRANYAVPPEEMDAKGAAAWYSTRGCQTAKMTPEETREWLKQLHGFRGAHLSLLEQWCRQLAQRSHGRFELRLPLADAATLVSVLNDHRLLMAARHDIGQAEMDLSAHAALKQLSSGQQTALFEIHFLAWIIEEVLRLIAPEAADWMH